MRRLAITVLAAAFAASAGAQEKPIELKGAPGLEEVQRHCSGCHSLDYIPMNSPFLDASTWGAEVTKMIRAFGAPVNDGDAKRIVEYLARNYAR